MTYFAIGLVLFIGSIAVATFWLGMATERAKWERALERPMCWRCQGTGAEPTRRRGRWADQ